MRKILDVLRLFHDGARSRREIARAVNTSPTTVGEILRRAQLCDVSWPLPAGLSELALEAQLYPPTAPSNQTRPEPDWPPVQRELRRKGVTLELLWQEYKAEHPDGYRYSGFCALYRQWVGRLSLSLRQTHAPGEKLFVDYAGQTVPVTDPLSGEIRQAAIFVAVLGASNYTYSEATWSQSLPDWIGSHVRSFEYLGGVTALVVPDNLKNVVTTTKKVLELHIPILYRYYSFRVSIFSGERIMALLGSRSSATTVGGAASQFKVVLTKLATDKGYLQATSSNPEKLLADYPDLTVEELDALRDAAVLSGADLSKVDPLHSQMVSTRPGSGVALGGNGCCCCCCCGVTGKIIMA